MDSAPEVTTADTPTRNSSRQGFSSSFRVSRTSPIRNSTVSVALTIEEAAEDAAMASRAIFKPESEIAAGIEVERMRIVLEAATISRIEAAA